MQRDNWLLHLPPKRKQWAYRSNYKMVCNRHMAVLCRLKVLLYDVRAAETGLLQ